MTGSEIIADVNSIGLQWFATLTRKPAASPSGASVGPNATTTPVVDRNTVAPYTGVIVVGAVLAAVLFIVLMFAKK